MTDEIRLKLTKEAEQAILENEQLENKLKVVELKSLTSCIKPLDAYYDEQDFLRRYIIIQGCVPFMTECIRMCDLQEVPSFEYCRLLTDFYNYDYIRKVESVSTSPSYALSSLEQARLAYAATVLCEQNYMFVPEWTESAHLYQTVAHNRLRRKREDCDPRALKYNIYGTEADIKRV